MKDERDSNGRKENGEKECGEREKEMILSLNEAGKTKQHR